METYSRHSSVTVFFRVGLYLWDSSIWLPVLVACSVFWLSGIWLHECTAVCLFIHQLTDSWLVSSAGLLWVQLLWIFEYNSLKKIFFNQSIVALKCRVSFCLCECCHFNCVRLFVTLCALARQAPLSMWFSWQEYWSALPFPSSGDFPNPGTEPKSPPVSSTEGGFFTADPPGNLSLQMAQFHFFLWLIFHYIYVPYLLYPFPCWWMFSLFSCPGYCK